MPCLKKIVAVSEASTAVTGDHVRALTALMVGAEARGWALFQGIRAHPVPQDIWTQDLIVMAQLEAGCLNFAAANSWTHEIQGSKVPWPLAEVGW